MIYLDNSATTRPCSQAVEAMMQAMTQSWGNPSALYNFGIDTARQLKTARHTVAAAMGAEPDRVFFTSGGTEADNWAVFSTAKRYGKRGRHIITTAIEHHAILNCMKELEARGFEVTYLQPDNQGRITVQNLKAALRPDTILVSIMMVNNEVGSVMPISQMAKLTHKLCPDALFHTDAVQGFLKVPFAARTLGADLISVSSHKVHGPKGAGALYVSPRLKSFPPCFWEAVRRAVCAAVPRAPLPFSALPPPVQPEPLPFRRILPGNGPFWRISFRKPVPCPAWFSTGPTKLPTFSLWAFPGFPPRIPSTFCRITASASPQEAPVPRDTAAMCWKPWGLLLR